MKRVIINSTFKDPKLSQGLQSSMVGHTEVTLMLLLHLKLVVAKHKGVEVDERFSAISMASLQL